jgi:hypothetical protein
MAHFLAIRKDIDTLETAELLMRNMFKIHGLPNKIISDRGGQFAAQVLQEMYDKLNVRVALSTAYHPQMDGQTERVNQDLETYLQMFCTYHRNDWAKWLHLAEFTYNNKEHSTIKTTPFMANNLSNPKWSLEQHTKHMIHPAGKELIAEMARVEDELCACLNMAAERMKQAYDTGTLPLYEPGDKVFP